MLSVVALNTFYGRAHVLFDLHFAVARGEVVALLGRNGAGKSTTLKSIIGLVPPISGEIRFAGRPVQGLRPYLLCRLGLGYVPEDRRIFSRLTVAENLEAGRQPPRKGAPEWTPQRLFRLFPNLAEVRGRPAGQISGGEQQMLSIARTLMGNPRVILLDEPSTGLAPRIVQQLAGAVLDLKAEGVTVLLSEQNLHFAAAVADTALVMETGHIRWHGPMAAFAGDAEAKRAYLHV